MILQYSVFVSFQVDVLVNNGARGQLGLIRKTPLEVDRAILDLNTVGTISLTKAILPHMIERRKGQIVVVSSLAGKSGKNLSFLNSLTQNVMKMLPNAKSGSSSNITCFIPAMYPLHHWLLDHSLNQFSPNNVRCASSRKILRIINTTITNGKIIWSKIKFSQLILYGNVWRSVWRICMCIQYVGLKG